MPLTFMTAWHALVVRAAAPARRDGARPRGRLRRGRAPRCRSPSSSGPGSSPPPGRDAKLEKARALGADEVVNYETQDFVQEVKRLTERRGVDVVFEHVGKKTWEKSILAAGDRRPDRDGRRDDRLRPAHRPAPRLLPAALDPRLHDGHGRRPRGGAALRRGGEAPAGGRSGAAARRGARKAQALLADRAQFGKIVLEP